DLADRVAEVTADAAVRPFPVLEQELGHEMMLVRLPLRLGLRHRYAAMVAAPSLFLGSGTLGLDRLAQVALSVRPGPAARPRPQRNCTPLSRRSLRISTRGRGGCAAAPTSPRATPRASLRAEIRSG